MTKTAALTELNGAKIWVMVDATGTTSVARVPLTITKANQTGGGDSTNDPAGYLGVGTHNDADTILGPGGWTFPIGSGPIVLNGGADSASATEGSRIVRPMRIHEGGALFTLPGSSLSTGNAYQKPLTAAGGSFLTTAGGANNETLTTTLASNFGYMTDICITVVAVPTAAATVLILDASSGTTLHELQFPTLFPPAHTQFPFHFTTPLRTNAAAAAFFVTTTGTTSRYAITCNGFFATA